MPAMPTRPKNGPSRRDVLKGGAAVASALILPRHLLGGAAYAAPSKKLNLAGVGIGGVAHGFLKKCSEEMNIRALCDVDDVYGGTSFQMWPDARRFRDYREMFDLMGDEIDAVLVGTPDHTHAVVTMEALRRGKHTCCVKPLTRTIHECRTVLAAARAAGVATQVTASPNTSEEACRTCELIWEGAIGEVHEVHVWSNRPLWPQGMTRPEGGDPVPGSLDWDLWLGPAAERPFKDKWAADSYALAQVKSRKGEVAPDRAGVYHPWNFRGWWDFGTGALGDMGCHRFNTLFRVLKLDYPTAIHATATRVPEETFPLASIVTFDFPKREGMPPLRMVWYDGGLQPPRPKGFGDAPLPPEGELYVGTKGVMFRDRILDEGLAAKYKNLPKTLPRRDGTFPEWFEAIAGGAPAGCNFDWAGLTTETVLLGAIALKTGRHLEWDAKAARFVKDEEADALLNPPYRKGWSL
jgi:predicted dehydrogenase